MNELTDETVIARVRAALDEAHATESAVEVVDRPGVVDRREWLRWAGIAAAGVVMLGAVGWAVTRPDTESPVATLPETPTVPATTTVEPSTSVPGDASTPWFVLANPDLVPARETTEEWTGDDLYQAWEVIDGDAVGVVFATVIATPTSPTPEGDYLSEELEVADGRLWIMTPFANDTPNADSTTLDWGFEAFWARSTGEAWAFRGLGVSKQILTETVRAAAPGSGVPIIIADPRARLLGIAGPSGTGRSQTYTSTADGSNVVMRVGDSVLLGSLNGPTVTPVTVAGRPGWQTTSPLDQMRRTLVMWDAGNGWWGQMLVPPGLANRIDGLIAAVAQV